MKGIILAGGYGTRLYPATLAISKQLMPVYDKPMIYYPLSLLMLAGIQEILIISTPFDILNFKRLLKDGRQLGLNFTYKCQTYPRGLAEAFIIAEDFIQNDSVAMVLGDNIFYGHGLQEHLINARDYVETNEGGVIFTYAVKNPSRYGVVEFNEAEKPINFIEKPRVPPSNKAVTGLYFYDNQVIEIAKSLKPSKRGELEITAINQTYLEKESLSVRELSQGFAWLDAGTHQSFIEASNFVATIEKRQGVKVGCIEEIAYQKGWIGKEILCQQAKKLSASTYGAYLANIAKEALIESEDYEYY